MIEKITRRNFLKNSIAISGGSLILATKGNSQAMALPIPPKLGNDVELNAFVVLDQSSRVKIVVARSEMGQGVRTSMAMLVAEELDVDWAQVEVLQADGDRKYGDQNTDGSRSVRLQWLPLRKAGAAARMMLISAAAQTWAVPKEECRTEKGRVFHDRSKQNSSYGDLVAKAASQPVPDHVVLKDAKAFRIIGSERHNVDARLLTKGAPVFGMDVHFQGMRYASLERCPVVGGRLVKYDDSQALAIPGVEKVVRVEPVGTPCHTFASVAVIANSTWAALKGRKVLKVTWDYGENSDDSSAKLQAHLKQSIEKPGRICREEGDTMRVLAHSQRSVSATYHVPYLNQAPMEPLVCTAWVKAGSCEIWAPTQAPQWAQSEISKVLKLETNRVKVHVTRLGGGFGRKAMPDFTVEAAMVSKAAGVPVQVMWRREDDMRHSFYHSESMQFLKAALDEHGKPIAWLHRSAFPTIHHTFQPGTDEPRDWEMNLAASNIPYRISNIQVEACAAQSSLRRGWMRSVANIFHSWAVNSFVDELAVGAKKDPIEFQLEMLGEPRVLERNDKEKESPYKFDTGRLAHVIKLARDRSGWKNGPSKGRNFGFAAQYSFLSYVAMVLEASINGSDIRVHRATVAVDCGTVVNPGHVRAQIEGAIVYGLSLALYGEISMAQGRVLQSNFHDYPVLRIHEMPEVQVELVASQALPTGVGEPGVPPVAPALCNALFAATGERIYQLPLARSMQS